MTRAQAIAEATASAKKYNTNGHKAGDAVVVREGPYADEFAERDADGESYGYCPVEAFEILYGTHGYATRICTIDPKGTVTNV